MNVVRLYENSPDPVEIEFDPVQHKYVLLPDRVPITANVTSVTDKISTGDKTGALMGWALKEAGLYLEENWPILDDFGASIPPMRRSVTDTEFQALIKAAKSAHRKKKKEAASIGGQAHDWIDKHIKALMSFGEDPPMPEDGRVINAILSYLEFEKSSRVRYVHSERKVYSKKHNYVGTLDRLVEIDGKFGIQDLKTSNSWRHEYECQISAYETAWMEEFPEMPIEFRMGLMVAKDEARFEPIQLRIEDRAADFAAFLGALEVFRWEENLKERV